MAVYRVHQTKDYTVMSNVHLKDKRMSLKAKGLLSVMLSLPDGWDYSVNGLCSILKENQTAVKSTLDELKDCGYLVITKLSPNATKSGRIEYQYDIFETPQVKQDDEKQGIEILPLEIQHLEILAVENHTQLNTKESSTKKYIQQQQDACAREDEPVETETVNPDLQRVVKSYQTQIGEIPNGRAFELLTSYVDDLGADAVIVGIEETNLHQPQNPWTWLKKVLDGFADAGVHDRDGALANVAEHRRAAQTRSALPRAAPQPTAQDRFNYQQHTYTEADFGADFYANPLALLGKEDST